MTILAAAANNESRLMMVLVELAVIVGVARIFGVLFRRLGQPTVVGEIAAGIVLGPSVFGKLEQLAGWQHHELSQAIFNPMVAEEFKSLSQLGLILLLFLIGLEFEFGHLKKSHRSALAISVTGVIVPFALGWGLAHLIAGQVGAVELEAGGSKPVEVHGFALFMGTAMAITALPVLGRMMMEFNITRTRLAAVTISAAAVDDATGWILLASVSAMVRAEYQVWGTLRMAGLTLAFALGMIFLIRPLLVRWSAWELRRGNGELGLTGLACLLIMVILAAIATSLIGIFAIFGAFTLGAVLSDRQELRAAISRQLLNFVTVFFLPIFFTYTGLRTDIGTLTTPVMWGIAGVVLAAAIAGKLGGCTVAARVTGNSWRESFCVGSMMNTRGLMELIVINVGYELGIIPRSVYCMLVLMAIATTFMTTPLLQLFRKGTELDEPMKSAFGRGGTRETRGSV